MRSARNCSGRSAPRSPGTIDITVDLLPIRLEIRQRWLIESPEADQTSREHMSASTTLRRPRIKPAQIRREKLMDAAQALFLGKGFEAASVDEVVRAADVAKGTFYFYFKTKHDVLQGLRARFIEEWCGRLEAGRGDAKARRLDRPARCVGGDRGERVSR
jgi:Bacterial regulatory proteins, tetR family